MWLVIVLVVIVVGVAGVFFLRSRREPGTQPLVDTAPPESVGSAPARLERIVRARLQGQDPSVADLVFAGNLVGSTFDRLAAKNGVQENTRFAPEDRAEFYLVAVKATFLEHPDHNAWPMLSGLRRMALPALRARLANGDDPLTLAASVTPALLERDVDYALACYRKVQRLPVLAAAVICWVRETVVGFPAANDPAASRRFLDPLRIPIVERVEHPELSREQRWALAAAVFPTYAADPRAGLAAAISPAASTIALRSWWKVVDNVSAKLALTRLLEVGHRAELAGDLAVLDRDPARAPSYLVHNQEVFRKHRILAWDLCRAIQIVRSSVRAGYLTEQAGWEWMAKIADRLSSSFPSWAEMGEDYVAGSGYFEKGNPDPYHTASIDWLEQSLDSPWRRIRWELQG